MIATLLIITVVVLLVRHFHVKNFHIIKPEVLYTSGQPRGMDYTRLLYKYHIGTIVNIRSASEHREQNWYNEEITWVRNNGVEYFELPIDKDNYLPDKETRDQFLDIMADKNNLPVLLHGVGRSKRVAMLTAVWLIKGNGLGLEQAVKVVKRIKGRPPTETEMEFISRLAD